MVLRRMPNVKLPPSDPVSVALVWLPQPYYWPRLFKREA